MAEGAKPRAPPRDTDTAALVNSSYRPAFPLTSCSTVQPHPGVWPPGRGKQTAGEEPLLEGDGAARTGREAGALDKSSLEGQCILGVSGGPCCSPVAPSSLHRPGSTSTALHRVTRSDKCAWAGVQVQTPPTPSFSLSRKVELGEPVLTPRRLQVPFWPRGPRGPSELRAGSPDQPAADAGCSLTTCLGAAGAALGTGSRGHQRDATGLLGTLGWGGGTGGVVLPGNVAQEVGQERHHHVPALGCSCGCQVGGLESVRAKGRLTRGQGAPGPSLGVGCYIPSPAGSSATCSGPRKHPWF